MASPAPEKDVRDEMTEFFDGRLGAWENDGPVMEWSVGSTIVRDVLHGVKILEGGRFDPKYLLDYAVSTAALKIFALFPSHLREHRTQREIHGAIMGLVANRLYLESRNTRIELKAKLEVSI